MTWLVIALIALLSLLLWRFMKLSERVEEIERCRITNEYRVEQTERELRFYVRDVYDKVLGLSSRPRVSWWLIQAPVVMHEGTQVHLMDIVGYGSNTEAWEYAKVLSKKHAGKFESRELRLEEYQKLKEEQTRLFYANGCHYVAARPFFHYADSLSEALDTECSEAGDQEADAQPFAHLGSRWVNGRLVKADSLWEQLRDLQHKGSHLHIS